MKSFSGFVVVMSLLAPTRLSAQAPLPPTRMMDTTVAMDATGRFKASNSLGDLIVHGWDRAEVRVRIALTGGDRMKIGTPLGVLEIARQSSASSKPANMELWVPRRAVAQLINRDGTILLENTEGAATIDAALASVTVNGTKGAMTISTSVGNITVTNSSGSLVLTTSAGVVRVSDTSGDVRVESNVGDLTFERVRANRITAASNRGLVRLSGPIPDGAQHDLTSHGGNVVVSLDSNANVTVFARALRGVVQGPRTAKRTKRDDGQDMVIGKGTATLRMNTFSGTLRVTVGKQASDTSLTDKQR